MASDPKVRGFILAAGYGTRLAPVTDHLPKPLLPVADGTLLSHAVSAFDRAGISDIAINCHHLGHLIETFVDSQADPERFTVFPEKDIMGTGGALHGARDFLAKADCFVVFNGDVLCDVNLNDLINAHLKNDALATLLMVNKPDINTVHLNSDQAVIHIEGAGPETKIPANCQALTYSGIGVFSRRILEDIGPGFSSLIDPLVRAIALDAGSVQGLVPKNIYWDDLGTLPRFLQVTQDIHDHPAQFVWLNSSTNSGYRPLQIKRITGHGSDRHFWRFSTAKWSAIAMQSPASDVEFVRQLAIGKFLNTNKLGAAKVYSSDEDNKVLLMEDLGAASLYFLARNPGTPKAMLAQRYRQVVDHLLTVQSFTEAAHNQCPLAVDRCLDKKVLLWETAYFRDNFLVGHGGLPEQDVVILAPEFEALATVVARQPRVLLHRDFQSQNIHFQDGKVRLVDIQGMRLGPLGYDIMSLVMDPYVQLSEEFQNELLEQFINGCCEPSEEVRPMLVSAGLQRLMQALGAYGFLGHKKGKTEYLQYIPRAMENLQFLLSCFQDLTPEKTSWLPASLDHLHDVISEF